MVLWEITVATAYFLGLKRTYRIALKIQRRLTGSNTTIRQFLRRRTRAVFDVAVKVHKNIQHRDIEAGRSLGNWILRGLDRARPSAQIRPHKTLLDGSTDISKHVKSSTPQPHETPKSSVNVSKQESNGQLRFTSFNMRPKSFPIMPMMTQPLKRANMNGQFRHISYHTPCASASVYRKSFMEGVVRKDIAHWILHG